MIKKIIFLTILCATIHASNIYFKQPKETINQQATQQMLSNNVPNSVQTALEQAWHSEKTLEDQAKQILDTFEPKPIDLQFNFVNSETPAGEKDALIDAINKEYQESRKIRQEEIAILENYKKIQENTEKIKKLKETDNWLKMQIKLLLTMAKNELDDPNDFKELIRDFFLPHLLVNDQYVDKKYQGHLNYGITKILKEESTKAGKSAIPDVTK